MSNCCHIQIQGRIVKESSAFIGLSFFDQNGLAVTPTTISWTLTDIEGNIINGREDVSVTPATSVIIRLNGDDLGIPATTPTRLLEVLAPYNDAVFGATNLREVGEFVICE